MRKKHFLSIILFTIRLCMALPHAWINEIHYDNAGTDCNEFVEVVVKDPEQHYLGDLVLYMYNGYDGVQYCLDSVDEFDLGDREGNFQFYTWFHRGIQNDTEGMILVYYDTLIQAIAYEGPFIGRNEPADGIFFEDIGISETGNGSDTCSIYLSGLPGTEWCYGPATPGHLNAGQDLSESTSDVKLLNFNCEYQNASVHISWRAANEIEVIRYQLYKNGQLLAWLNAHGTSSEPHEYEYLDRSTIPGQKVTYVLGETTYSQPVNMLDTFKVFIPTDTHFSLKAPFPNPANPESVIEIDVFKPCNLKMRIYDLNGHKIRDLIDNNMTVGKHKIALDLHNLPSGKYIVKCETKDQVKSFDVTLLK